MNTVTVTRIVHADPETVWPLLADVTAVVDWHPSVQSVDLLSDSKVGLGAARRCNFYDGTSVQEVISEVEEGKHLRVELSEFSMPMKHMAADLDITPTRDGHTQVVFRMEYEVKFGVFGKAMNALMVRGQMSKLLDNVLAGLDHHSVTGEIVGKGFEPKAA